MYSQLIGLLRTKEIKWDFPLNSYKNICFSHVMQLQYTIVGVVHLTSHKIEREHEWKNFKKEK